MCVGLLNPLALRSQIDAFSLPRLYLYVYMCARINFVCFCFLHGDEMVDEDSFTKFSLDLLAHKNGSKKIDLEPLDLAI
jgi:hypothetical protein